MIARQAMDQVRRALARQAAVAIIGPRQVGKTTLAHAIADERPSIYLDLESAEDRAKLTDPALFLQAYEHQLVILDEIHRLPEIFQTLRGLIDQGRRRGHRTSRFLILGSAAIDFLRQSGESLAGRIEYIDLDPLDIREVADTGETVRQLWVRGGFPESFLARHDDDSFAYRRNFIRTYLERDVPQFGPRIAAQNLERLWTMLAHSQGTMINASRLATSLSVTSPTVTSYIDLLVDLLLVRRLQPYATNLGKRLVKSPKIYIRDSGLAHALLGIDSFESLAGHPIVGMSWEGFVIETLLAAAPPRTMSSFYRTSAGAEIDLLLELPGNRGQWAIEIKRSLSPRIEKGFHSARADLGPDQSFVVHAGTDRYPLTDGIEAIGLRALADLLTDAKNPTPV